MKEIFNSLQLQINDRLSSPLFGSFIVAWVSWNNRLLFVLFSNQPVEKRFDFIDKQIYPTAWDVWNSGVIKPTLSAILFIYLYPIISKHFYGYWLKRQVELKKLRDTIESAALLTVEESRAFRMAMIKIREEYESTINRQAAEIEALRKNSPDNEFGQLRKEAENIDQTKHDRAKFTSEINNLVDQGTQILMLAQGSPSPIAGVQLSEIASWVTRLGEVIRKIYGVESQQFTDYTKAVATQNFYNIHSNWHNQIAMVLGIAKSMARDLEQDKK
jgi:hypothetical protein